MSKVLILAGDAAEDLETMFIKYRRAEAGYEPHVAAPTTRPIKLVVHATARRCLPRWGSCADAGARASARSRRTSRWRAASTSTALPWSTETWSRAVAGATLRSGRAPFSTCSTALPSLPDELRVSRE